jgi:hypothetical protein
MTYDDVNEYDQRGILEGSLRNGGDGLVWRVMIGVLYENADQQTAIAARFTDAGWVYSLDQDHGAQLAHHDGFVPRLVCFGPAEPTLAQRNKKPARISTDVALAQTLGDLAWLHDRSTAMMHPTLLDELHRAWLKLFDREVLGGLPASAQSLGVEGTGKRRAKSRYVRPDKADRVGRCEDLGLLEVCEWKDRIARPPSQFSLVSVKHKFDVGLNWAKDDLHKQLLGRKLWSWELVSFLVGMTAKRQQTGKHLVSHIPLVDYHISKTARNAPKTGITQKEVKKHTGERHQLLRHLESDIHQFDRIYGFGLVDNHYFAIVVMVKERKLHIIDSMPTDAKALERIQKVSRRYKNTMLILISSSPATSIARWQGR